MASSPPRLSSSGCHFFIIFPEVWSEAVECLGETLVDDEGDSDPEEECSSSSAIKSGTSCDEGEAGPEEDSREPIESARASVRSSSDPSPVKNEIWARLRICCFLGV